MVTFVLTNPVTVGDLGAQQTVRSVTLTGFKYNANPELAPLGAAELDLILTADSGFQHTVKYRDATATALWNTLVPATAPGKPFGDLVANGVFQKLIADGKLPAGTVTTS